MWLVSVPYFCSEDEIREYDQQTEEQYPPYALLEEHKNVQVCFYKIFVRDCLDAVRLFFS